MIHRFVYPDPPHDAEALLINGDGTPIIITKEDEAAKMGAAAGLYVPAAAVQNNNATGVPLKRVGEFKPPATDTANPLSTLGRGVITGAATSPDRKRVVLRTYADAFEWDVPDGDVVKAITTGKPRITPLPNEPMGEAITYSADGATFLTVTDNDDSNTSSVNILQYTRAVASTTVSKSAGTDSGADSGGSWQDNLTLQDLLYGVAAVGGLGLVLVAVGVFGIRRSRQLRRTTAGRAKAAASVGSVRAAEPRVEHEHDVIEGRGGDRDRAPAGSAARQPSDRSGTVYGRGPQSERGQVPPPDRAPTPPPERRRGAGPRGDQRSAPADGGRAQDDGYSQGPPRGGW